MNAELMESITRHVTAILEALAAWDDECEAVMSAEVARLESEGYRVIDGWWNNPGDDYSNLTANDGRWQIVDYRTREVVSTGSGNYADFDAAYDLLGKVACLSDGVLDSVELPVLPKRAEGLPDWLAEAITSGIDDNYPNPDRVREFLAALKAAA